MMDPRLLHQLSRLEAIHRRTRVWRRIALCTVATAGAEGLVFLVGWGAGWNTRSVWWWVLLAGLVTAMLLWWRGRRATPDLLVFARGLEPGTSPVQNLLRTAAEQQPDPETGTFDFLQRRVVEEMLRHPRLVVWKFTLTQGLARARKYQTGALILLALTLALSHQSVTPLAARTGPRWFSGEMVVTPGDTELERGMGLVITARFDGPPPAEAFLVLVSASGKTSRLALARNLSDPVLGTSLPEVQENSLYRIEYGSKSSRDYKINVFEYPALVRADAALAYPAYTGLTNRTIRDTLRISAVEGTQLDYQLQLNKPVTVARLLTGDQVLPLALRSNAVVTLDAFTLTNSARYQLELVDGQGRTNKVPAEFAIQVLSNRPPEVKLVFPRGDQRVSSLEELQLQAQAKDDFGLLQHGIGFSVSNQEPTYIELGTNAPANQVRPFQHQIALEKLGVQVDQVVSYFAWADDYGPDGEPRRTYSDMFFAEIRPFEEIFRADQSGEGGDSPQQRGESGNQGGNQSAKLAELQKQIIIATWKLQHDKSRKTQLP